MPVARKHARALNLDVANFPAHQIPGRVVLYSQADTWEREPNRSTTALTIAGIVGLKSNVSSSPASCQRHFQNGVASVDVATG